MKDYALLNSRGESDTIFVPLGSIEVHSNLPYGTDTIISRACAILMAQKTGAAVFPPVYTGVCPNTQVFDETIGIDPLTFIAFLEKIALSLLGIFSKVVFINIHNGNDASIRAAIEQLYLVHRKTALYINPYSCLGQGDPFTGRDNNIKEASLLFASLEVLGIDQAPYFAKEEAIEAKDNDIAALKKYGYFGYSYLTEGQHISPAGEIEIKAGMDYLNMVAEQSVDIILNFEKVLIKTQK